MSRLSQLDCTIVARFKSLALIVSCARSACCRLIEKARQRRLKGGAASSATEPFRASRLPTLMCYSSYVSSMPVSSVSVLGSVVPPCAPTLSMELSRYRIGREQEDLQSTRTVRLGGESRCESSGYRLARRSGFRAGSLEPCRRREARARSRRESRPPRSRARVRASAGRPARLS